MTTPSHDPTDPPLHCPWWCVDRDNPDHPDRHESEPFPIDAERPADTLPVTLNVLLSRAVGGSLSRIVFGIGDDDYVSVASTTGRSLAAVLIRLSDTLEGLVSL